MYGTCPGHGLLTASQLVALDEGEEDIRPIAVGDLVYRVLAKAILKANFRPGSLLPCQFGVGTGVEPAIRLVQRAKSLGFTHLTSLDFSNAFNTVDRVALALGVAKHAPAFYRAARWVYG